MAPNGSSSQQSKISSFFGVVTDACRNDPKNKLGVRNRQPTAFSNSNLKRPLSASVAGTENKKKRTTGTRPSEHKETASSSNNDAILYWGEPLAENRSNPQTNKQRQLQKKKQNPHTSTVDNKTNDGGGFVRASSLLASNSAAAATTKRETPREMSSSPEGSSLTTTTTTTTITIRGPSSNTLGQTRAITNREDATASSSRSLATEFQQRHSLVQPSNDTPTTPSVFSFRKRSPSSLTSATIRMPLFQWLDHRASHGRTRPSVPHITVPWKVTPWLALQTKTNISAAPIRLFSWDCEGVLLAVVAGHALEVYDWDSVLAADRQGRNRHARYRQQPDSGAAPTGCFCIEPIISVPLRSSSSSSLLGYLDLQWNKHNPDEVALLHLDGHVRIYDLGQVMAWADERRTPASSTAWADTSINVPPHLSIRLDSSMTAGSGHTGHLLFVSATHLLVSLDDQVACYTCCLDTANAEKPSHKLLWKWTWPRPTVITSMIAVPGVGRQVLIASQKGTVALLDWRQVQRAAFSSKPVPKFIREWSTINTIGEYPQSPTTAMAVLKLSIREDNIKHEDNGKPRMLQLSWHTSCGWALQAELDLLALELLHIKVLYSTDKIVSYNDRGDIVSTGSGGLGWSMPTTGSVAGTYTTNALLWNRVPAVSQILPRNSDHRVLSASGTFDREPSPPTVLHYNMKTGQIQSIPLTSSSKGSNWTVSAVSLHPSLEWMVVAVSGAKNYGLRIYNARSRA